MGNGERRNRDRDNGIDFAPVLTIERSMVEPGNSVLDVMSQVQVFPTDLDLVVKLGSDG